MKTTQKIILSITGLLALIGGALGMTASIAVGATPLLQVFQGGTGSSTLTGILYGNGTSSVRSVIIGANLSFSGGTLSATAGSGAAFPFSTYGTLGVSTSTLVYFSNGLMSTGSSTVQWLNSASGTIATLLNTSGTSTNFAVSNVAHIGVALLPMTNGTPSLGGQFNGFSTLWLKDSASVYDVGLQVTNTGAGASHNLTFDVGNYDPTLTFLGGAGNPTLGDWFDQNVKTTGSPTFSALKVGTLTGLIGGNGGNLYAVSSSTFATFSYPFPSNATSSLLSFTGGIISTASSTVQDLNSASSTLGTILITRNATGTNSFWSGLTATLGNLTSAIFGNATSTNFFATQAMFTTSSSTNNTIKNLTLPQFSNVPLAVTSAGTVYGASTSTPSTFTFATSSLNVNSTTTISLAGFYGGATITQFGCSSTGGTFTSVIGNGTASSTYVVSANGLTTTYTALSTNNSFGSGVKIFWAIGPASAAGLQSPSCSWLRN